MAAGDVFSLTLVQQLHGVSMANVFYMKTIDDLGSTDEYNDVETAFVDQVQGSILAMQNVNVAMECYLVRRILPTSQPTQVFLETGVGTKTGPAMPANSTFKFRHYSGNGDKNRRGRWFIGGVSELLVNGSGLNQSLDAPAQLLINIIEAVIVNLGQSYRLQHFSRKLNLFFDIDSALFTPQPIKCRPRTPGICSIS